MTPPPIRASGAGFTYARAERPAFRDLELDVEPGSVLLVVGPSGSGKSTFARGVAGLLPWQFPGTWQGSLLIDDTEVAVAGTAAAAAGVAKGTAVTTRHLDAGIVLQDPASQLVMERVRDDVAFGLENAAWPLQAMRARVPEVLGLVGLGGFEDRRSTRLSGGEQQRVAIAGVLAMAPGLLVLDEPTASLDPEGADAVASVLRGLREQRGTTIVLVEHRADLAWPLADLVLALAADGHPIDAGRPADVLARSGAALARAGIWLPSDRVEMPRKREAAPGGGSVVDLDRVSFEFDHDQLVLHDVSLQVRSGERVGLLGRNGSGKTTLLRLALGLLRPTAGRVTLGGRNPARLRPREMARLAGYCVQNPELGFLADTVREEVELGLDASQVAFPHELCDRLGLPIGSFGARSPYRLSGGEQRRLSLVTALARRPALLALDEPTYGQDRIGHEALVAALDELVGQGSAVLAATHDARFAAEALDREVRLP